MMQEILISLVEIILMLMLLLDSASNILEATPLWLCIPAPTMETLAQVVSTLTSLKCALILQSTGRDGKKDISFTCSEGEADLAMRVLKESAHFNDVSVDTTCAKVSIVGAGMQSHSGVASKMFEALSNNNINIKMISTSEIKISCIINRDDADKAVSAIHDMLFD
jgi:aspartate kinase